MSSPTRPSEAAVRPYARADRAAVVASTARAFDDDPVWAYALRQETHRRERAYRTAVETAIDVFERHGLIYCANRGEGMSIWAPPGAWKTTLADDIRLVPAYLRSCGVGRLWRGVHGIESMKRVHPKEAHYYLYLIAVDPNHQGRGLGGALMAPMLDRCDREGSPAYLESTKESNLAFYRRHGFEVKDRIAFAGRGPPIWTMWRRPREPE